MTILGLCGAPGRAMHVTALSRMLSNPFYSGTIRILTSGEEYPGVHRPLINQKLFDRVQDVLKDRSNKKTTRHEHLYRGLFKCGLCGSAMTPEAQKGWVYYRCHKKTCSMKTVREDLITTTIQKLIVELSADIKLWRQAGNLLRTWYAQRPKFANPRNALMFQFRNVEERIRRTTDAYVDKRLVQSQFDTRMVTLKAHQSQLKSALEKIENVQSPKAKFDNFCSNLLHFRDTYETFSQVEQRELLELCTTDRILLPEQILIRHADPKANLERLAYLLGRIFHRQSQNAD